MTIQNQIRSTLLRTALYATSTLTLLELTTHLPTEGRSSLAYHKLFDAILTPLGRRILGPEEAHHLALEVVRRGWAPRGRVAGGVGVSILGGGRNSSNVGLEMRGGHVVDMKVQIGLRQPPQQSMQSSEQSSLSFLQSQQSTQQNKTNNNKHQHPSSSTSSTSTTSTESTPLTFSSPIGLAAGFDKNGIAIPQLFDLGFSFVEIGSITPLPQPGNPKPRSFRLVEDKGVINRFGFNSEGVERVKEYLEGYRRGSLVGVVDYDDDDDYGENASMSIETHEKKDGDNDNKNNDDDDGDNVNDVDAKNASSLAHQINNSITWALGWAWNRIMTTKHQMGVLGVNLGKNKTSTDEVGDYITGIRELGPYADYLVINVSSPNTPGLRSLQQRQPLHHLLTSTLHARNTYAPHAPLFVKLAPDLTLDEMSDVATVILQTGIDGMIVSNTTNARPETLLSKYKSEIGGLSGAPIKDRATQCIRTMYTLTDGSVPIIGVGGVGSGRDAYEKLRAGASLVQIYSMMVYEGPGVVSRIREELGEILVENGFGSVEEVVGLDCEDVYWRRREERVKRKMMMEEEEEEEEMVLVVDKEEEEMEEDIVVDL